MTYELPTKKLSSNSGDGKTTTESKLQIKSEVLVQVAEQVNEIKITESFDNATTQGTSIHQSLRTQNDGDGVVDIRTAVAAAAAAALATTDVVHLDVVDPAAIVAATASKIIEADDIDIGINFLANSATTTSPGACTVNDSIIVKNEISMISQQSAVLFSDSTAMMPATLTSHSITTDLLQDMTLPNAITDAVVAATNAVDVGAASVAAMAAATAAALATTTTSADQDTSDLIARATAAAFEAVSTDDDGGVISIDAATLAAATSAAFAAVDQAATDEAIAAVAASLSLDHDTSPTMHPILPPVLPLGTNTNKRKSEDNKVIKRKRVRGQKVAGEKAGNASKTHAVTTKTIAQPFPSGDVSVSDAGSTATKRSRSSINSFNSENDGSEQHGQLSSRRMKDRERYAKMTPEQRQLYNRKRREQYHRQTEISRQKRRERERNRYHALPQEMTHERNSRRAKLERDRYQKLNAEQLAIKNKARRERAALARQQKQQSPGPDDSAELDSVSIVSSTKPTALQSDPELVRNAVPGTEENKKNAVDDENDIITLKTEGTIAKV